jgi:hypothetical protein
LFSLPYIAILLCIFTAWIWGGVIAGGVCAVGRAMLAPFAIPAAHGGIRFAAAGVTAGSTAATIKSVAGTGAAVARAPSEGAAGLGAGAFSHNASLYVIINYPDKWRYYLVSW